MLCVAAVGAVGAVGIARGGLKVNGQNFIGGGVLASPLADASSAAADGKDAYGSNACSSGSGTVFSSAAWCPGAKFSGGYHGKECVAECRARIHPTQPGSRVCNTRRV